MVTAEARSAAGREVNSRIENYRNLSCAERLEQAVAAAGLADADRALLAQPGGLPLTLANGMIENVVGTFELPLGIATNFTVNGKDYLIPMAVEEPSVVAAASYMARIARGSGGFRTSSDRPDRKSVV